MITDSLFSIVIPIYNSEKYLLDCIQSVQNQTYSDLDIILVDDGSTDSCKSICEKLLINDKRLRYFYKKNGGVSSARNYGLREAKGEYISFIDSDDFIDKRYVESILELIDKTIDMVVLGHLRYNENEKTSKIVKHKFINKTYTSNELKQIIIDDGRFNGFTVASACAVCFRTSIIRANNILFNETVKFNEDGLFTSEYVLHCSNNIILNYSKALYYYRINNSSATQQIVEYDEKYIHSMDNIINRLSLYVEYSNNIYIQISRRKATKTLTKIMSMVRNNIAYDQIRSEMYNVEFMTSLKKVKFSSLTLSFKIIYILLFFRFYKIVYWIFTYKIKKV